MINQYDIAYGLAVGVSSPLWLSRGKTRRKFLQAFNQRMGRVAGRDLSKPAVMIHAVSLGEINATRSLIDTLRRMRPGLQFIVSVTTDTGFARGTELYGLQQDVSLVRYPLDFTSAVDRLLTTLRPDVVALMELEMWPNFIHRCASFGVPVLLINGRITPKSHRKYKMFRAVLGSMFRQLSQVCVQDDVYARRFAEVGVPENRISVTGTMKFDTAPITERVDGQEELAAAVGLTPGAGKIWVCGSTGPGEEKIILPIYRNLLAKFPDLQLAIIPRKPERFDEVAQIIAEAGFAVVRRSRPQIPAGKEPRVVLGDTMGELRKFYALADIVFVGRTLVDLGDSQHGSDMIEPAALARPVIVGPFTANFAEPMGRFLAEQAMEVVPDARGLESVVLQLIEDSATAASRGARARQVVRAHQGATDRHARIILAALDQRKSPTRGKTS